MTTLLDEINLAIDEKENKKYYQPKQSTIDGIGKRSTNYDYQIYQVYSKFIYEGENTRKTFFKSFTGVDSAKIRQMSDEMKNTFREKIKDRIENLILREETQYYYLSNNVKNKIERVRFVTKGDISKYHFVEKEDIEMYFKIFKRFMLLNMEDLLGFVGKEFEEKLLAITIEIIGHPYTKHIYSQHYLSESGFKYRFKNTSIEKLKKAAYEAYQKTANKPYENINVGYSNPEFVEDRMFLFNDKEIKKLQEEFLAHFKEVFDKVKGNKTTTIQKLEEIKADVEKVLNWL